MFARSILCAAVSVFLAGGAWAADYGMVADVKGSAELQAKKKPLVAGESVAAGEKVLVKDKAVVVLVTYSDCSEWKLTGPIIFTFEKGGPVVFRGDKNNAIKTRKLSVCYKPGDVKSASSHEMGALSLMAKGQESDKPQVGPSDGQQSKFANSSDGGDLEGLKADADGPNPSNATLMMMVMHYQHSGDKESAKKYFMKLKESIPDSEYVKTTSMENGW